MADPVVGKAVIHVGADTSDFTKDLVKGTAGVAKTAGSNLASAMGKTLKVGAAIAGAGVAGVLGTALAKGFSRLKAIDDATGKLKGLGHSAKDITLIMNNALASVKGTAFGLGDAASQAANLVAAGIKPGKDLTRTLKLLADTSSVAGVGLDEMGGIFSKVAATGKLTGDDLQSMTDRGIPALQFLAKSLGVSAAKASEMVSAGKVGFPEFQKAMESGLGGAAQASGKTFTGAMNNTLAALGRLGAGLLSGVFTQLPSLFGNLIGWVDKITPSAKAAGETIGGIFSSALSKIGSLLTSPEVKGALTELVGGIRAMIAAFKDGGNDITSSGFAGALERVGIFARDLWDALTQQVVPALIDFGKNVAIPAVETLANVLWNNVIPAMVQVGLVVLQVVGFFQQHQKATIALATVVLLWLGLLAAAWVYQGTVATINSAKSVIAWVTQSIAASTSAEIQLLSLAQLAFRWAFLGVQSLLGAAKVAAAWLISMGPIVLVIAAVVALVIVIVKNWDTIKKVISAGWEWVKTNTIAVWNAINSWLLGVWDRIKSTFSTALNIIKTTVVGYFNVYKSIIMGVFTAVKVAGDVLWAGISKVFSAMKTGWQGVSDAFSKGKDAIGKAWSALQGLASKPIHFVLATVINGGLIAGFNWLSSKIGGPSIGNVPVPFAQGGVLPGYTPGRDVHQFYSPSGGRLALSGGEAIMRPEFTRMMGGKAGIKRLNDLAKRGIMGNFAQGGVHEFGLGGIIDWIGKQASSAFSWVGDKGSAIWQALSNPIAFLRAKMPKVPGSGLLSSYAGGAAGKLLGLAGSKATSMFGDFNKAYSSTGGPIFSKVKAWVMAHLGIPYLWGGNGPRYDCSSFTQHAMAAGGVRIPRTAHEQQAFARSIGGGLKPGDLGFNGMPAHHVMLFMGNGQWAEAPHTGDVTKIISNTGGFTNYGRVFSRGGVLDPSIFDRGGVLQPGLNLVRNNTGRPEALTPAGAVTVHMTVAIDDLAKLNKLEAFIAMLDQARVNGRRTARSGVVAA
jgi:tape measure domain-containing protein